MPEGRSPRRATIRLMPFSLYTSSSSPISARVPPTQDRCGAVEIPCLCRFSTVSIVRSRVEPPAPKVTEKKSGFTSASWLRTACSFSLP